MSTKIDKNSLGTTERVVLLEGKGDVGITTEIFRISENSKLIKFIDCGGQSNIEDRFNAILTISTIKHIAIIEDADCDINARWNSIAHYLQRFDDKIPNTIPQGKGYVHWIQDDSTHLESIGVWLMPDCMRNGMLEDFVLDMLNDAQNNELYQNVFRQIDEFINNKKQKKPSFHLFKDVARSKAIAYTYKAWNKEPDASLKELIKDSKQFNTKCSNAKAFDKWLTDVMWNKEEQEVYAARQK